MRIAIITGASSGMGREFVRQLSAWERFDELWVIARREERLKALAGETDLPIRPLELDLAKPERVQELEALLAREQPEVGLLINCAGYGKFGRADELSTEEQLGIVDLNDRALTAVALACLPYMRQGGRIVQLGSLSSFQPVPYMAVYGASKAYVLAFSRALNQELRPRGIRVMAVCPGWVRTEFFDRAVVREQSDAVNYYNRFYTAEQVVSRAYRDLYRTRKDLSICGLPVRNQVRLVKLLPHSLVMKIWLKQQHHA